MIKFIYKITNKINGECYIGQTNNWKERFADHKCKGRKSLEERKTESNKKLYLAFDKYGLENFTFEVIDESENYDGLEQHYIEKYDSINNGYNMIEGGG